MKQEKETSLECAERLFSTHFFGPVHVEKVFGKKIEEKDVPPLPYLQEELETAARDGDLLVLRVSELANGRPLTIENLMEYTSATGKKIFLENSFISQEKVTQEDFFAQKMPFFCKETPALEWRLLRTSVIKGTNNLSYNAQMILFEKSLEEHPVTLEDTFQHALDEQIGCWKEVWGENFEKATDPDMKRMLEEAVASLPAAKELVQIKESLPKEASLPKAVEVLYDYLLVRESSGKSLLEKMAVFTRSTVPPFEDEPERPIDFGVNDPEAGAGFHIGRDLRYGRVNVLGVGMVPGIPVGLIQH